MITGLASPIWTKGLYQYDPSLSLYLPLWHPQLQGSAFLSADANRYLATVTGAIWGSQGRTFDGADDKIAVAANAALQITGAITLSAWINPVFLSGSWRMILVKGVVTTEGYMLFAGSDAAKAPRFILGGVTNGDQTSGTAVTESVWQLVTATYDGSSNINIYIDGVNTKNVTNASGNITDSGSLLIGLDVDGSYDYNNLMGEVWIYNRALSVGEILRNYQVTRWRYQ